MHSIVNGWLFDVYPSAKGITLWFIDRNGIKHCCFRRYRPSFFLHVNDSDTRRVAALSARSPVEVSLGRAMRKEIYSGDTWDVVTDLRSRYDAFQGSGVVFRTVLPSFRVL